MFWVPLPWWTSKSKMASRDSWWTARACMAPMATLLNTQKPIASMASAWWPGGRMALNALAASPAITASTAAQAAPAARSAASPEWGLSTVSASTRAYPLAGTSPRMRVV